MLLRRSLLNLWRRPFRTALVPGFLALVIGLFTVAATLNRLVPAEVGEAIATMNHVENVEPYLVAIEPIAGYYMTLHTGVRPGDARRPASRAKTRLL